MILPCPTAWAGGGYKTSHLPLGMLLFLRLVSSNNGKFLSPKVKFKHVLIQSFTNKSTNDYRPAILHMGDRAGHFKLSNLFINRVGIK